MRPFVHLHVHSHYSKGWGIPTPAELCAAAQALQMGFLALTDTNGLYGMIPFLEAARATGIRPIVGSELCWQGHRALLLVKSQEGYGRLCRLLSERHCRPEGDLLRSLREMREGLVVISDDIRLLKALREEGREDLYVEMSPGFAMAKAYALSRRWEIPPVATNRVCLLWKEQYRLHRILRAAFLNTTLSQLSPEETCRETNILASGRFMMDRFAHAPAALENSVRIAESCEMPWDFERIVFPRFEGMDEEAAFLRLRQETMEGCRRRYNALTPEVLGRVEHELSVIREKHFARYFLVVAQLARKAGHSCGRGSGGASLVAYALGITQVDPLAHGLLFERFLNAARKDPPDLDVDLPWDERDRLLEEAFALHGSRRMALVATHNTFGARAALRDVAKVFGLTEQEIASVTSRIGWDVRLRDTGKELFSLPQMKGLALSPLWEEILEAARALEGHFRHLSTHCGGVVIVPDEIRRYCPVEISPKGLPILQWDKEAVESAGLVKIDLLGNRSLAVIRDAMDQVRTNYGISLDYASLNPLEDPATLRIFYGAETMGVFYFESPATRQLLVKVASGLSFEQYRRMDPFHLNVIVTSIIRPASNRSIRLWVSRLHGEPWQPPHPLLGPVLEESLGVMVFQEQLSLAAVHLAGFNPAEADTLRRIVAKKHKHRQLRDFYDRFLQGARQRGVGEDVAREVWEMMMGFEGYSFCKPHSASYTLVAYKAAYLRAHYPAEFMAAVISNGGGYYDTFGYLSEARRMGLEIRPPHINQSEMAYTGKDRKIRVGLMQIKGLSREAAEALLEERKRNGPYASLGELLARTAGHLQLQDIRLLLKAGCLDPLAGPGSRPALLWEALRFFAAREGKAGGRLFGKGKARPAPPRGGAYPLELRLRHEREALGLFLSVHPLQLYAPLWRQWRPVPAREMPRFAGKEITALGWWITGKTVRAREGEPMRFVSFEDLTGIYEAVFFPNSYRRFAAQLSGERPYLLRGRVEEEQGAFTLNVKRVIPLGPLPRVPGPFKAGRVENQEVPGPLPTG